MAKKRSKKDGQSSTTPDQHQNGATSSDFAANRPTLNGWPVDEDCRDLLADELGEWLRELDHTAISRIKNPDEVGDDWHLCRDFIDPLADELEEWLRKRDHTADDIECLRWFAVGMNGVGPDSCVNGWNRTRAFLMLNVPMEFRQALEDAVSGLAQQARSVLCELENLPLEGKDAQRRDVTISSFEVQVVEPCLTNLRQMSQELQRRWPAKQCPPRPGNEATGEGDGRAGPTPPSGKKRGRPRDTDPKADKRIYDAWKTGQYRKYSALACAIGITWREVKYAIDRHGKRLKKAAERARIIRPARPWWNRFIYSGAFLTLTALEIWRLL